MPARDWRYFPVWKSSTNKVLIDLTYVVIPPKPDPRGYLSVPEDKLMIVLNQHGQEPKMELKHYIDAPEFHALAHAVCTSQRHFLELAAPGRVPTAKELGEKKSYTWTDYKGREQDGAIISNRMAVTLATDPERKSPWIIAVEEGPGVKTATGAFEPKRGAPTQKVLIYLSTMEMRQMMLMGLEHAQAQTMYRVARQFSPANSRPAVSAS